MEQNRIIFEFTTQHGVYRDVLYLPADHTYTDEEINAMKQQRVDNWIAIITAPTIESPTQDG